MADTGFRNAIFYCIGMREMKPQKSNVKGMPIC